MNRFTLIPAYRNKITKSEKGRRPYERSQAYCLWFYIQPMEQISAEGIDKQISGDCEPEEHKCNHEGIHSQGYLNNAAAALRRYFPDNDGVE